MREIDYLRKIGIDHTLAVMKRQKKLRPEVDINIYEPVTILDLTDDEEQCILSNPCYRVGDLECFESCYWHRNNFMRPDPPVHIGECFTINDIREMAGRKPIDELEGERFVPLDMPQFRSVNQIRKTYGLKPISEYHDGRTRDFSRVVWKQDRTYDYTMINHTPEYTFNECLKTFTDHFKLALEPIGDALINISKVAGRFANAISAGIYCRLNGIYDYTMIDHGPEYARDETYYGVKLPYEDDDQEPSGGALYEPKHYGKSADWSKQYIPPDECGGSQSNTFHGSFFQAPFPRVHYIPYEEQGKRYDYEGDDCDDEACGCDDWCIDGTPEDPHPASECKIRCKFKEKCGV